jgi:outer membrane protein OmpA-like peptidoglycan-associated protein
MITGLTSLRSVKNETFLTLSMRFFYTIILSLLFFTVSAQRVYFDFNKYNLRPDARQELDKFIENYKLSGSNIPVMLFGHCDSIGSHVYNDLLSKKRVFAVHDYLLNHGIPKNVFSLVKGLGKREPVNSNITPEERQQNRYVEIVMAEIEVDTVELTTTDSLPDPPPPPPPPDVEPPVKDTVKDFTATTIDSVKEGEVLRLKNINFYGGRHTFLPQSMPALNELLEVMKSNPKLEIEIQGHICCRIGSGQDGADFDSGDEQLSLNRARAVYYFLADNGISKRRMTYRGFAALYPLINPELTETDRTLNRRVEIKIVKK